MAPFESLTRGSLRELSRCHWSLEYSAPFRMDNLAIIPQIIAQENATTSVDVYLTSGVAQVVVGRALPRPDLPAPPNGALSEGGKFPSLFPLQLAVAD